MSRPGSAVFGLGPEPMFDKQKFADLLFTGDYFPRNLFNEIISRSITKKVENDIREALNNMKRVQIVEGALSTLNMRDKFKPSSDAFKKDDELAEILCKRGDEKSTKADIDGSLRYYNLALLAVPTKGKRIGEIYGRRAAMSVGLKDHKSCLKDVDMVLKYDIKPKFKERISGIQTKLVKICSRKKNSNPEDYLDKLDRKKYRNDVMYRVEGPSNPKIPVAAECIQVAYNKDKGRYLVTTADLAAGKTIIVEDPYLNILENTLRWDTQHCAACCKKSSSLIPCDCMFVMYCDEKCRVNGLKNGHAYECMCLPQLHALRINWMLRAAFRIISKAGPVELRNSYTTSKKKTLPISEEQKKGFNPETGIYEIDSYYQISELHTYFDKIKLPSLTVMSVILVQVLDFNTNYFHAVPEGPERDGFISFVASRILLHSISFTVNNFGLTERVPGETYPSNLKGKFPSTEDADSDRTLSSAVYPFISLIEHSCYPNAWYEYLTNGRMAIITNQLIKAGEEITISYGYFYWRQEIVHRRAKLNISHHFLCHCIACRCHWPETNRFNGFLCPNCSGQFHHDEMVDRCVVISFKDGIGMCRNCKREINLKNTQNEILEYVNKYWEASELVLEKKPLVAIPLILDCIKFFQRTFCPPSSKLVNAMILLGDAYGLI